MSGDAAVWLIVAILLPTGAGYTFVLGRRVARRLQERRRRPTDEPIERLGADLRRLNRLLDAAETAGSTPGKQLRFQATRAAYVDALTTACRRLDVPPPAGHPASRAEIYRVESDLRRCGLDVRPGR